MRVRNSLDLKKISGNTSDKWKRFSQENAKVISLSLELTDRMLLVLSNRSNDDWEKFL